jgi:hypothetical protein
LDGPQYWSGQVWSRETLMPPLGFKPQTIKPIMSCYAEYAVLAPEKKGEYILDKEIFSEKYHCKIC